MKETELASLLQPDELLDVVDLASDQDEGTWLTDAGKRVAAIVPVDVAEAWEQATADLLAMPVAALISADDLPPGCTCPPRDWKGTHLDGCPQSSDRKALVSAYQAFMRSAETLHDAAQVIRRYAEDTRT